MKLGQKQELFSRLLPRLLDKAIELGFEVRTGETQRFEAQCVYNSTHCRKCKQTRRGNLHHIQTDGHKFRAIGILNSLHRLKLAVDITLFRDGQPCWSSADYADLHDYWEGLHELAAKRIRWDGGHFSIGHGGRR